jgi:CMP-2-keto-3-deoxyoctulosonic acid synthetase
MVFKVRKHYGTDKYYLYNTETKKRFSNEPLDKETAMAQLRALYAQEGIKLKEKRTLPSMSRMVKGSEEAKQAMLKARNAKKKNVST